MENKSIALINKGNKYFVNTYKQFDIVFEKGEGCYLYDSEGNKYLDFVAGIAVNALGYSNDSLIKALQEQVGNLLHCSNLYWNEKAINAAEKLASYSGLDQVFFCNSGAEANEGALKLARKYGKKYVEGHPYEILTMKQSFHGRTFATVTATGQEKYQKELEPLFPGINYAIYNDIEDVKAKISEKTCAILVEPLQGEGGIKPAEQSFLQAIRNICDEKNIVLIFDEVQTGIGRSGELLAYQYYGIKPDIVTLAKGLGSGVPVGAFIANEKIAKAFEPGDHASTFGGNLLATTAVNTVLDEISNQQLLAHVKEVGKHLTNGLNHIKEKYPHYIKDVRGFGLIQGIEIHNIETGTIIKEAMNNNLLLIGAGTNVIRFVPPLIVSEEEIDLAMSILDKSMEKVCQ